MITTILSKINLIKTSNNVLWNIFHKTLIHFVFIHVNNFILSQLRQPPTTDVQGRTRTYKDVQERARMYKDV